MMMKYTSPSFFFFFFFFRKMLSRSELGLCQLTQPVGKSYNAE